MTIKNFLSTNLFFFIVLLLIVFIVYGKSINFGLSNLDDDVLITRNLDYISKLSNIPKFFLTGCYFDENTQYYRPILNISFAIEAYFFSGNLKVYHTTNILLYILSLFTIFAFLAKLQFNKKIIKFIVLLFSVHPVLSSVPVWIPARNDTLLTIFFLLSLINFLNYIKTDKIKYLILHFLFFSLSLFSKETTVLLIFIYPLLVYCFNFKTSKKQIIYNSFFIIILLLIYFLLRSSFVQPVHISEYFNNSLYYIKNIVIGIMFYVDKIIYPNYMPIMLYNIKPTTQICIINIIAFSLITFFYFKQIISKKIFIFACVFAFLAIISTFALEDYLFLTHRIIVSLSGILIILVSIIEYLIKKYPKLKKYFAVVYIFLFLLFSIVSFINIDKYKDSFTYWSFAYSDASNYHVTSRGLAMECLSLGYYDKAIELLFETKKLKNIYDYDLDICTALISAGKISQAKDRLLSLLKIKEDILTLTYLSEIYYIEGDIQKSMDFAKRAYKIDKNNNFLLDHILKLPKFDYQQ